MTRVAQLVAMARRDVQIQRTYHFQFWMQLANIPLVLFTYFFLGKLVGHPAELSSYEGGYFEFALIGFLTTTFATVALSAFSQSITAEQHGGTLEVLLSAPATRLGTVLAGALAVPIGLASLQAVFLFGLGWYLSPGGFDATGIPLAVLPLTLTIAAFCALGVLSAALIVVTKRGDPISGLVLQATNVVAGALFPVALLPGPIRVLAQLFPAYHGFEGMRAVLLSGAGFRDIAGEVAVLVLFLAVLFPASVWAFARAVRIGRLTGTLGNA